MEAARTSETSVDNYFTRQYIPEDKSELHTRRRKNLKSHIGQIVFMNPAKIHESVHEKFKIKVLNSLKFTGNYMYHLL
jgi:hypothetical protein